MLGPGTGVLTSAALGVLAGIMMWALTGLALSVTGVSDGGMATALPVGLAVAVVIAPLLYWRRRWLLPFLAGLVGLLLCGSVAATLLL